VSNTPHAEQWVGVMDDLKEKQHPPGEGIAAEAIPYGQVQRTYVWDITKLDRRQ
jgi:hypothetical protein